MRFGKNCNYIIFTLVPRNMRSIEWSSRRSSGVGGVTVSPAGAGRAAGSAAGAVGDGGTLCPAPRATRDPHAPRLAPRCGPARRYALHAPRPAPSASRPGRCTAGERVSHPTSRMASGGDDESLPREDHAPFAHIIPCALAQ
jgi:hypothetical protein